jgi:stage III sporulation protein AE
MTLRRAFFSAVLTAGVFLLIATPVCAYDPGAALDSIRGLIPQDIEDYIPDELFDPENGTVTPDSGLLVRASAGIIEAALRPVLKVFATITGFVIIMSVFAAFRQNIMKGALTTAFETASAVCMALCMFSLMNGLFDDAFHVLEQLGLFMNGMLPVMTSLYAAGGNIATATVSSAGIMALLTMLENIARYALYPVLRVCFGLSLVSCAGGINLSGISALVRNTFIVVLSFIMSLMSFFLAYQTRLALSADSAAIRTIKFAAGSFIPVVGGAVGEAVRLVMGSLSYIKSAAGVIAVIVIVLIVLPVILRIFLYKMTLAVSSCISKILGCERESAFLAEMSGLLNLTLAILSACSVLFILNVTLFIKSAAAG